MTTHLQEVGYLRIYWFEPYKEQFVKVWVDRHLHFGNIVTSRVEGIHWLLKQHLKTSQFDLFDA